MNASNVRLPFKASIRTTASRQAVYDLVADLRTHLRWAGEEAPKKDFRLLTMEASPAPAHSGDEFASTGAAMLGATFHDRSTVVVAEPPARFGFDTQATLLRKHAKAWRAEVETRYEIEPADGGSILTHTCVIRPSNYVPWWFRAPMRRMSIRTGERRMLAHLRNLARIAEGAARVA
jgi:hypothetical protein